MLFFPDRAALERALEQRMPDGAGDGPGAAGRDRGPGGTGASAGRRAAAGAQRRPARVGAGVRALDSRGQAAARPGRRVRVPHRRGRGPRPGGCVRAPPARPCRPRPPHLAERQRPALRRAPLGRRVRGPCGDGHDLADLAWPAAQAHGVPFVATVRSAPLSEEAGIVVPRRDPRAIADSARPARGAIPPYATGWGGQDSAVPGRWLIPDHLSELERLYQAILAGEAAMRRRRARPLHLVEVGVPWPPETFLCRKLEGLAARGMRVTVAPNVVLDEEAELRGVELLPVSPAGPGAGAAAWRAGLVLLLTSPRRLVRLVRNVRRVPPVLARRHGGTRGLLEDVPPTGAASARHRAVRVEHRGRRPPAAVRRVEVSRGHELPGQRRDRLPPRALPAVVRRPPARGHAPGQRRPLRVRVPDARGRRASAWTRPRPG